MKFVMKVVREQRDNCLVVDCGRQYGHTIGLNSMWCLQGQMPVAGKGKI